MIDLVRKSRECALDCYEMLVVKEAELWQFLNELHSYIQEDLTLEKREEGAKLFVRCFILFYRLRNGFDEIFDVSFISPKVFLGDCLRRMNVNGRYFPEDFLELTGSDEKTVEQISAWMLEEFERIKNMDTWRSFHELKDQVLGFYECGFSESSNPRVDLKKINFERNQQDSALIKENKRLRGELLKMHYRYNLAMEKKGTWALIKEFFSLVKKEEEHDE